MITVIHLRDSPFVGGPEKQILGQCARLDRSRFAPVVASFTRTGTNAFLEAADDLGICTEALPDGKLAFHSAVRRLRTTIERAPNCVVIASGFKADFTAMLACSPRSIPWMAWFHGSTGATPRVRLYEALDMLALRRVGAVIAVCERAATDLRACGLRRVLSIPNAIDAALINSQGTRETARAELGIGPDELLVGTAARLSPEKGIENLIDAVPAIIRQNPSVRFIIIGDGPIRASLERRAAVLGIADRLAFVGFRSDATFLVKAFDVFVLPSLRENLPVALLEAMACGVSVVATDVGGVREVLTGTGAEPVAPGSVPALAHAVNSLLADPRIRADLGKKLFIRAEEFSFERQLHLVENLIEKFAVTINAALATRAKAARRSGRRSLRGD